MTPERLGPDDPRLPATLDLIRTCFAYMDGRVDPPSSIHRMTLDVLADHAARDEVWVIGAAPVAAVILQARPETLYLGKLAVAKAARGTGLARLLLKTAIKEARQQGLPTITLQSRVELTENHTAFRKMGFTKTGETAHHGYDRPTSFTFTLTL